MSSFDRLISQIDTFIRKFYKNEILKGLIFVLGFLLASWLVVSVLEYFGRFNSWVRFVLFWTFVITNGFLLVKYLVIPLFNLTKFGKKLDRYQASKIIGTFFPDVSDRLLNTLQLNDSIDKNDRSYELISASVAQKSNSFTTLQFVDAVRTDERKKYLLRLLPVGLLVLVIGVLAPKWLLKGSSQVVNYNTQQEAPFRFSLSSSLSNINEGDSLHIAVDLYGIYVPNKVYLLSDRGKVQLLKTRKNRFEYTFENVRKDFSFSFQSESFTSPKYVVSVLGKGGLRGLTALITYPGYIGKVKETIKNPSEIQLPEGARVNWNGSLRFAESVKVFSKDYSNVFKTDVFKFSSKHVKSDLISFVVDPKFGGLADSSFVKIEVLKDQYPGIQILESTDSVSKAIKTFDGVVNDDYGLTKLNFCYTISKAKGPKTTRVMQVEKVNGISKKFSFSVDFSREDLDVEDRIDYFFTVWDNDGVNGSKSSNSQTFRYMLPSLSQLNEDRDKKQDDAKNDLSSALSKVEKFNKDIEKLQKAVLNQSKSDFKSLEQLKQLQMQQENLQSELMKIQEKLSQSNDEKNQLSEPDKELVEQQQMIDELLKELMDDELKDLLKQMEELMKNNQKQQLSKEVEKLDESTEDMKEQMSRTLESLKKLQVNEKIDDLEKELNELAEEQLELKDKQEKGELDSKEAEKRQDDLIEKFEELKEDMKELQDLNDELKRPLKLGDFQEEQKSVDENLKSAKEKLSENKKQKAGEKQKSAAEEIKKMAEALDKQQEDSNQKQDGEDMATIRLLLENLMALSFDQEYVMSRFGNVRDTDPVYRKLGRKQRDIIDDTEIVEDSLISLARRQSKIAPFIDGELREINANFGLVVDEVDEHRVPFLLKHQQLVMTSFNNLALMLNESLQSMQEQQKNKKKKEGGEPGSGSCDNPGGSKPSPSSKPGEGMGDMKEMLKKQLEQMKKGMKPGGESPGEGGSKPGGKEGKGSGSGMPGLNNEGVAKMVAQQTAIRQALEKMREEMNKEGKGVGNGLNPLIQELEKQERDLLKGKFTPEMLYRQQDILTRLLESDKAMRERGFEEKRESNSGKNPNVSNLIRFDEYTKKRTGQIDLLRTVDPMLTHYYKGKAGEYFNKTD